MPERKGTAAGADTDTAIDTRLVRKLAAILTDTGLSEIEVERGELKIRVARQIGAHTMVAAPLAAHAPPQAAVSADLGPAPLTAAAVKGEAVTSPMVGTAYLSPQPGAAAFIKVGDKVDAGQTLLIVEAMKTMNPIPSPRAGVVAEIIVADAQPVEYGEPLVILE
jgi:acetyl-CoA carboxylase biotin carboxyl carrier protein